MVEKDSLSSMVQSNIGGKMETKEDLLQPSDSPAHIEGRLLCSWECQRGWQRGGSLDLKGPSVGMKGTQSVWGDNLMPERD